MKKVIKDIVDLISSADNLVRILPLVSDIGIIEYDGCDARVSYALSAYMARNGIDPSSVKRIVLLGEKDLDMIINKSELSKKFPCASISMPNKHWSKIDPYKLKFDNILVIHNGASIGVTLEDWCIHNNRLFNSFISQTRAAYFSCILEDNGYLYSHAIWSDISLTDFSFKKSEKPKPKTKFCKEKLEYLQTFADSASKEDAIIQSVEEAIHGCEECNQCTKYSVQKQCPYAQNEVAKFFRKGLFVQKNETIAHQWAIKAARQHFIPAIIQVADDLKDGIGCKKDIETAMKIYSSLANFAGQAFGQEHCIDQIIDIADKEPNIKSSIAIPLIAWQALNGSEENTLRLYNAFKNGNYGLPKDKIQQKEWLEYGAKKGSPKLISKLAKYYEENKKWDETYIWYKKLKETDPSQVDSNKLEEVEVRKLTNGADIKQTAYDGLEYLFGYYGKNWNLDFAYRCLNYASEHEQPMATGLLGYMYLYGLKVDKDSDKAISLLTKAAEADDLYSMAKLIELHHSRKFVIQGARKWETAIAEKLDSAIIYNQPFAHYLKGVRHLKYDNDEFSAFECIKKASELGIPKAQYELSKMYADGRGCDHSNTKAKFWHRKAVDNGYYKAEGEYGVELFNSNYHKQKKEAFPYLKKAYEKGYMEACWPLAQCYMKGMGTDIDKNAAYPLYERAAEDGEVDAQAYLCEKYFRGDGPLPKDYTLCAQWGEKAIAQGNKSIRFETAYASSHIGNSERAKELYLQLAAAGNACAMNNYACELSDPAESADWFLKAAKAGDDYGMWNIGKKYRDGRGVEQNIDQAISWLEKASNQGHSKAMMDLSDIYSSEKYGVINGEKAKEWLEKAIKSGEISALFKMAELHERGVACEKNVEMAIHYYELAAEEEVDDEENENKNQEASFRIGRIYENEEQIHDHTHKAIYWYRKAANKGYNPAKEALKRLKTNWIDEDGNVTYGTESENETTDCMTEFYPVPQ